MYHEPTFEQDHKPREECGVFGVALAPGSDQNAAYLTYNALFALQHRGQESAGIAIRTPSGLKLHKGLGLVPEVFTARELDKLSGAEAAIGHVRYAPDGVGRTTLNAQPLSIRHGAGDMALCYNGRLVNAKALRTEAENHGGIFQTDSGAEIIAHVIVREHLRTDTTEDAILNAMHSMIGAYSLVVMDGKKLIAARDPNGYRPLCIGTVGNSFAFASESCCFEALGGTLIRDVAPGEVVTVEDGVLRSQHCGIRAKSALCMFEFIYFARPDSIIDGVSVDQARHRAGQWLARHSDTQADLVIGVPDSGLAAAMGFAQESGIPYGLGLMKNRYIPRTFIKSGQGEREKAVKIKLNALAATVAGKRVIMVDDSIVRGTTCARIVNMLREAGATQVHMKVSAPPFLNPCYFGTAIPDRELLAAHNRTTEEVCALIGTDSLQYLPTQALPELVPGLKVNFCDACFTGNYALPVPHED